jgi:hypothetical protein
MPLAGISLRRAQKSAPTRSRVYFCGAFNFLSDPVWVGLHPFVNSADITNSVLHQFRSCNRCAKSAGGQRRETVVRCEMQ